MCLIELSECDERINITYDVCVAPCTRMRDLRGDVGGGGGGNGALS